MPSTYYCILTATGQNKLAAAQANQTPLPLTQFCVGDSNGLYYDPTGQETALVHEVWRGNVNRVYVHPNNPSWIVVEAMIPANVGGFDIREAGVLDDTGALIAIAKYPMTSKPAPGSGSEKDLYVRMIFQVTNATSVQQTIDGTLVMATKDYVDTSINAHATDADPHPQYVADADLAAHLAETKIQIAAGTANAITVTTGGNFSYTQGNRLSFKAVANNTGNVTLNVDSKGAVPLLKLDGSQIPAGGIKSGKVYDVYYDASSGGRFFLLARASGTAVASDVLAGKTFSNDNDTELVGTMPNRGAVTITPSTVDQAIPAGYHNGQGKVIGDPDLIPANIRSGINIFGVAGTLVEGEDFNHVGILCTATGTATLSYTVVDITGGGYLLEVSSTISIYVKLQIVIDGNLVGTNAPPPDNTTWAFGIGPYNNAFLGFRFNSSLKILADSSITVIYTLD